MSRTYYWSICLVALWALLISESPAAPPPGYGGGSSGGFGFSIGGGSSGVRIGVGDVPGRYDSGYRDRDYYDRDNYRGRYDRDYYDRNNYGGLYGGSGLYLGGGSRDFRWGVGIPFGYDDYDWYAPYYNDYHRHYYNNQPGYYSGTDYYGADNSAANALQAPTMEHPPIPTAGQVARLTDEQLKMMIAVALDSYNKDLDGFNTGGGWKKHFKLAELKTHVTSQTVAMDAANRTLIADISEKFEAAGKDPSYEVITQPWGFQTLLVALKEYSLPMVQRQGHVLGAKTQTLKRSLDNISTGSGWKAFLEIDALEKLLGEPLNNNAEFNKKLEKILERFDEVNQNPQYKAVAELRGFDVTRTELQQYIHTLQTDTAKQDSTTQPAESGSGKASL